MDYIAMPTLVWYTTLLQSAMIFLHSTNLPRNLPQQIFHRMESIELVEVSSVKNSQGDENTGEIPKAEHIPLLEISSSDVPR